MTLRWKTVFIFAASLLGLLFASYLAVSFILMRGFLNHERQDTIQNVERIREVIRDSLVNLDSKVWDWANWNDLYDFAADSNPQFVQINLMDTTFVELKLNVVIIVDSSQQVLFAKAFDLGRKQAVPISQSPRENMSPGSPLLPHPYPTSSVKGLIGTPEGPLLIAARPILTSESKGPSRGTLIMGACLDAEKIQYMARETRLEFSVEMLPIQEGAPDRLDLVKALHALSNDQSIFLQPLSEEQVAGYALLEDISGKPISIVRVLLPRGIYQQGRTTLRYLIASLLIIGLVYSGVTLFLMEKGVLARVIKIIQEVDEIRQKADPRDRLPVIGADELSTLAHAINAMLEALEFSQDQLRQANEELEARVSERTLELAGANKSLRAEIAEHRKTEESLRRSEARYRELFMKAPVGIFQTTLEGRFLTVNPALAESLGYESPEELLAKIDDPFAPEHADFPLRQALLEAALQSDDGPFHFEGQFMRRDDTIIAVEVQGRVARDSNGTILRLEGFAADVTERRQLQETLREAHDNLERLVEQRTRELNLKTQHLEEANAALKALLRQRETDREEFEDSILSNVKALIIPCLEKLKKSHLNKDQTICLEALESHLGRITFPFVRRLSQPFLGLTPTEIQVAELLRSGKSTKEMAEILHLSESTVLFHRNNLRAKLGLKGKKANLRTHLQSFY